MTGTKRGQKASVVTSLRKKGVAKTLPSKAHATPKERTVPAELPEDDPYDFDIGLTDNDPDGKQQALQAAEKAAKESRSSQAGVSMTRQAEQPALEPRAPVQPTAQLEPGFLQSLMVKQEARQVCWTDSDSDRGSAKEVASGADNGTAESLPVQLSKQQDASATAVKFTEQMDASEAAAAPENGKQKGNVPSGIAQEVPKDKEEEQAPAASQPSGRAKALDPQDGSVTSGRGLSVRRPLSGASQGSTGSRKRRAEALIGVDNDSGRAKSIGQGGSRQRLTCLDGASARRPAQADAQALPACTSKGPTVMEAQESGEQFQLQDDIQYALDGLCSSALPCDRAGSAAKIAEMAVTRRGRLALRAGGLFQNVVGAAARLPLDKEPLTALSIAVMLLAFAKDRAEQAALRQDSALAVLNLLLPSQQDACVKTGDGRTLPARSLLSRILKDTACLNCLPVAQRLSPCSLATVALAGALDPQHASAASEELKAALLKQGVLRTLAELAVSCAERFSKAPKGEAARPLWDLHRCLLALEYATFACPANEEELVHMRLSHCAPASSEPTQERGTLARESRAPPSAAKAAALSTSEPCKELPTQISQASRSSSAPDISCSPPDGRMASMQLSQEDSETKQERRFSRQMRRQSQAQQEQPCSSAATEELSQRGHLFPAWLTQQVTVLFPAGNGAPSRGLWRDSLQCMLSVLMNLTHNNTGGTSAVVAAGGLKAAAQVVDSVLGPPEEEAAFVRIADRRRLLEGLDLVSTTLGLLINLVEQDRVSRPVLATLSLPHGKAVVPLLCRLMQAGGKQPDRTSPRKSSSPGLEVTEEHLLAREEDGAASIVEVYAALLLGFVTESDLAQQQVVGAHLEGGMGTVTAAVKRCLQFYVDANAITAQTEASLRDLIASLEASQ